MSIAANFPTTRPSLLLDFVNSGQLDPRITFSRASGATWFNSAGTLVGVDFSSTSLTIGTGWQTLTLTATAGVDRNWIVGMPVQLIASTGTNTMTGVVVSYTASTQTLVVSVASVVGSGTYSTWRVSNLSPRFDYNPATLAARGLLIEEARTNQILQSEDFSTTWALSTGNPTITTNAIVAPDGTLTADKLVEGTSNGGQNVLQSNVSFASGTNAYSVFAKAGERYKITLNESTTLGAAVLFDLSAGTVLSSAGGGSPAPSGQIQAVGNGWYRCTMLLTQASTANRTARIYVVADATTTAANSILSRTGDGTSGIYIWGAQLEAGAFPTSYIPTTTTALTRSADVASVNTLSPWYNSTSGTLFAEYSRYTNASAGRIATFSNGTNQNQIRINASVSTNIRPDWQVVTGGSVEANVIGAVEVAVNAVGKTAGRYATNDFQQATNGTLGTADTIGTVPSVTTLHLGANEIAGNLNGWLRRLTFYPRTLVNADLQTITA